MASYFAVIYFPPDYWAGNYFGDDGGGGPPGSDFLTVSGQGVVALFHPVSGVSYIYKTHKRTN